MKRCPWASGENGLLQRYHDEEWGVPSHEDRTHYEFLVLEGAQAGLSWSTILSRRSGYARAFSQFDPVRVARYGPARIDRLADDPAIIRNRRKIESAVGNAREFLSVGRQFGTFDRYAWSFVQGAPRQNGWRTARQIPATTPESDAWSKDLRRRGFSFVGSTIMYAHMQAVGMVNDHLQDCFRHAEVRRLGSARND